MENITRRNFIRNVSVAGAGLGVLGTGSLWGMAPNSVVNLAILGTGGRSRALTESISLCENVKLTHVADVDKSRLDGYMGYAQEKLGYKPKGVEDFRKILDNKDVDGVIIATPEHWHAPMAIMALQAGKHVYVEKPCSHNPKETEMLIEAQAKYGKLCQMGNQQRSAATSQKAIKEIHEGLIGDVYAGKAWYSNTRGSIGKGKEIPVPKGLNWDLWQGPAPRQAFRDNVHPYNWHWFRAWGTGEIHNNGTHEIDVCRWALGVDYPQRVVSAGGRYHFTNDDWEYFDTQLASYEFAGNKMISWDGKSCNGNDTYGRGRGALIYGTKGSMLLDREGTILFDLEGNEMRNEKEEITGTSASTADTSGFDYLTVVHMRNFLNAIRNGETLNAPIADAAISTQLCHLGNMAQDLQESLKIDATSGRVLDNDWAMKSWSREYDKNWTLDV